MAKRLLVVDDDPGLLLAVSETLRAEGYDVKTARGGRVDDYCSKFTGFNHQ